MQSTYPRASRGVWGWKQRCAVAGLLVVATGLAACNTFPVEAHPPSIVGKNCGTVPVQENSTISDPNASAKCFWQAYVRCQAPTLSEAINGVDSFIAYYFLRKPLLRLLM